MPLPAEAGTSCEPHLMHVTFMGSGPSKLARLCRICRWAKTMCRVCSTCDLFDSPNGGFSLDHACNIPYGHDFDQRIPTARSHALCASTPEALNLHHLELVDPRLHRYRELGKLRGRSGCLTGAAEARSSRPGSER